VYENEEVESLNPYPSTGSLFTCVEPVSYAVSFYKDDYDPVLLRSEDWVADEGDPFTCNGSAYYGNKN
jgi:hypothetical protein